MTFRFDDENKKKYIKMLSQCIKDKIIPNYFSRYALTENIYDPYSLPLDYISDDDIENAILEITGFWTKNKNNPKYERLLQQLLDENNKVKDDLLDPKGRDSAKKLAEEEYKKITSERYKLLDDILEQLAPKGYITTNELDYIYKELSKLFSEEIINNRIQNKKIPISKSEKKEPELEVLYPMLDISILQNIRNELNVFNYSSLYEFLEISKTFSIDIIKTRYNEQQNYWNKKPVNAEKTAAQAILGYVKTHLIDGESQKYDNGLFFESMSKFDPLIRVALSSGVLEADNFADLVSKAKTEGIEEDFAKAYVCKIAGDKKVPVLQPTDSTKVNCPNCYILIDPSEDYCENCGEPIFIICPKCKRREPASNNACAGCGLVFGDFAKINFLLEECRILRNKGKFIEALDSLLEAKRLSGVNEKIDKKISEVEAKIKHLNDIYSDYDLALIEKKFYKARDEIRKLYNLSKNYEKNGQTMEKIILILNEKIEKIEKNLQKALDLEHQNKSDKAILAYENILNSCKDCEEAKNRLARIPPEPCPEIYFDYKPGTLTINWKKSPSIGELMYYVVRKEGTKPTSVDDGTIILKTKYLAAEDTGGKIGHNYFYSVFTERKEAFSLKGTATSSILFYDDVKNFSLRPGEGIIEGAWDLPGDVKRVLVYRKEGTSPSQVGEGLEIPVLGLTKFIDKNVQNGKKYFYKVRCEFTDNDAIKIVTTGIKASTIPNIPPPMLQNYIVNREQSKIIIKWTPLERGSVHVYRSQKAPTLKEGGTISKSEISKVGTLLTSSGIDHAIDTVPLKGVCYYIPITLDNDSAIIGRVQKLTFVEDVSNLKANNLGSLIKLKWKWPEGCKQVIVSWRHDKYPESTEDTKAKKEVFTRAQYELKGSFHLNNLTNKKYFFKIYSEFKDTDEVLYSSGVGPETGAEVDIQEGGIKYNIKKNFFGMKYQIVFHSDVAIETLPELVLVAKKGKVPPLNIQDGLELARINNKSIGPENLHEIKLPKIPRPCFLKVFFSDNSNYQRYQIEHPNPRDVYIK